MVLPILDPALLVMQYRPQWGIVHTVRCSGPWVVPLWHSRPVNVERQS